MKRKRGYLWADMLSRMASADRAIRYLCAILEPWLLWDIRVGNSSAAIKFMVRLFETALQYAVVETTPERPKCPFVLVCR